MGLNKIVAAMILLVALNETPAFASARASASTHGHKHNRSHIHARLSKAIPASSESTLAAPAQAAGARAYVLQKAGNQQDSMTVAVAGMDTPEMRSDLLLFAGDEARKAENPDHYADGAKDELADRRSIKSLGSSDAAKNKQAKPADAAPLLIAKEGVISNRGMRSFAQAGIPPPVLSQVVAAFNRDPAMRGVPEHAAFHVVYEEVSDGKAHHRHPELRLAALTIAGKEHRTYCYPIEHDALAFVDSNGRGVTPLELASPVPGAPITSPFGWRIHPILDIRRFHEGVDFGAPTGTPVLAAEDGIVEDVGFRGNYGNYVRVRHSDQLETAYAHLNGFAAGMHSGTRVHRGQIIAYIGTTGWATGPHLYYEVIVDGEHLDPLRRDLSLKVRFEGAALRRFKQFTDLLVTRSRSTANKTNCLLPVCIGRRDLG